MLYLYYYLKCCFFLLQFKFYKMLNKVKEVSFFSMCEIQRVVSLLLDNTEYKINLIPI